MVEEVCELKLRYWFDASETQDLQRDNLPFQQDANADEMVDVCFEKPTEEGQGREYSLNEIMEMVAMRFPSVKCTMSMKMKLGSALKKHGFISRHHKNGNSYLLVPKQAA